MDSMYPNATHTIISRLRGWSVRLLLILLLGGGLGLGVHYAIQFSRGASPIQALWSALLNGTLFSPSSGRTLFLVVPQPDHPTENGVSSAPEASVKTPPASMAPAAGDTPSDSQTTRPSEPPPASKAEPPPPAAVVLQPLSLPTMPTPRDVKQIPTLATLPDYSGLGRAVQPLAEAPLPALSATNSDGLVLPVLGRDGWGAWQAYAAPPVTPLPPNRIALIITNLGMEQEVTTAVATKFPPEVAMAFTPYGGILDRQIKQARERGHEVFLSLPVEQIGYPARDPGPFGLLVSAREDENIARLEQSLARTQGYIGIIAEDGPFLRSPQMIPILKALEEHGLSYVSTDLADAQPSLARLQVTDSLYPEQFRESIQEQLNYAQKRALTGQQAVVMVPATPLSLQIVGEWMKSLSAQGITLVPPSSLFSRSPVKEDSSHGGQP